jgi:hypothetical protein
MLMDNSYYEDELSRMSISELDALLTELEERVPSADSIVEITYVVPSEVDNNSEVTSSVYEEPAVEVTVEDEEENTVSSNEAEIEPVSDEDEEDSVSENSVSSNSVSENQASDLDNNLEKEIEEE